MWNRIIEGDCIREMAALPQGIAQVVIADPPYFGISGAEWDNQWSNEADYVLWSEKWVAEAMRLLRDDGLAFIFGQPGKRQHVFLHVVSSLCRRHAFHDLLIWDRVVGYNERRDSFTPCYEMILVLRKSVRPKFRKDAVRVPYDPEVIARYLRDRRYKDRLARLRHLEAGKFATNLLRMPSLKGNSREKCGHPTQKPVALIQRLIASASDCGDLVLDPFLGSGTTAEAAARLGRAWLGIERHGHYAAMARGRMTAALRELHAATKNPPAPHGHRRAAKGAD